MSADQARAVKAQLLELLREEPDVTGVGLARGGDGWAVKVLLVRAAPGLDVPAEVDGVEVQLLVTGPIRASS